MSEVKVNKISPRTNCGTVQLGDSGDTITIPAGATIVNNGTQTGFGRTGTVNWDTTAKTASFTAVSGNGYFVNTTSGAITVTMPASPSAGDIVGIKDYAATFATNNVTVNRNGSNIDGSAFNTTLNTKSLSVFFVYVDGTQGWKATQSDTGFYGTLYVTATGGTVTCCGDYKIHTFTSPGTFTVTCEGNAAGSNTVDYLVVAGGGGGGGSVSGTNGGAGGGGAGGYRESSGAASGCYTRSPLGACVSALPVTAQGYPITVGGGGGGNSASPGTDGSNSVFSTITSAGGGGGGSRGPSAPDGNGRPGGSGGGGAHGSDGAPHTGGTGNTPPVSPPQGNNGANFPSGGFGGGGGGGAGAAATNANGANGVTSNINTTPTARAGGGGGANGSGAGTGGTGGGGNGDSGNGGTAPSGTSNTGSGGGGSGNAVSSPNIPGGAGGSGIVIIRYKYQ
jgi:hypothetical protein